MVRLSSLRKIVSVFVFLVLLVSISSAVLTSSPTIITPTNNSFVTGVVQFTARIPTGQNGSAFTLYYRNTTSGSWINITTNTTTDNTNFTIYVNTTAQAFANSANVTFSYNISNGSVMTSTFPFNLTVDNTNPTSTITSPSNNSYSSSASVSILGTGTDTNSDSVVVNDTHFGTNTGTYASWNFTNTSLSDGVYSLLFTLNDSAGNTNTTSIYFTVDTSNPALAITSPSNNANQTSSSISILGTASDTNTDTIIINDTRFGTNTGTYTSWNFTNTSMSDGTYTILVTANDSAGNTNTSTVTFTIDSTNPTVTLNSPANATSQSSGSVTFNVTVTDTNLKNVTLYLNGAVNETNSSGTGGVYLFSKSLTNGTYNWSLKAYDFTGNSNQSVNRTLTIDTTTPTITATSPSNNSKNSVSSITIEGTASGTNLDSVVINDTRFGTNGGNTTNWNFTNSSINDGNYTVLVTVNNTAGTSKTTVLRITIDDTAPTGSISCTPLEVNPGETVTCSCTSSDNLDPNPSETYTTNPSTTSSGIFTQSCTLSDWASNSATVSTTYSVSNFGGGGSSSSSGGGSSGSDSVTRRFSFSLADNKEVKLSISEGGLSVSEIDITTMNTVSGAELTVKTLTSKPSSTSNWKNSEKIYQYLKFDVRNMNDEDVNRADIKFEVLNSWFEDNNVAPEDTRLYRYTDGDWKPLNTNLLYKGSYNSMFKATTPGFSYFAIAGRHSVIPEVKQDTVTGKDVESEVQKGDLIQGAAVTEGSGRYAREIILVGIIFGILGGIILYANWRKKNNKTQAKRMMGR